MKSPYGNNKFPSFTLKKTNKWNVKVFTFGLKGAWQVYNVSLHTLHLSLVQTHSTVWIPFPSHQLSKVHVLYSIQATDSEWLALKLFLLLLQIQGALGNKVQEIGLETLACMKPKPAERKLVKSKKHSCSTFIMSHAYRQHNFAPIKFICTYSVINCTRYTQHCEAHSASLFSWCHILSVNISCALHVY